jgi:ribosome assembly protein YihI (activator of Der GTPase)
LQFFICLVTDKKETSETAAPAAKPETTAATKPAAKAAAPKPKKAPAKELPELMQEDVIPSLKSTLESQEDLSEIELFFQENRVSQITEHFFFWEQCYFWAVHHYLNG